MDHLLLGSLLIITLSAEKCNQERTTDDTPATQGQVEQPMSETPERDPDPLAGELDPQQLSGQRWYILTIQESELALPDGGERPWLEFNGEQLQGFGGCNNLMGGYSADENGRIHFRDVGSTKKYCPELQAIEVSILDMLAEANAYTLEEGTLHLMQGTRSLATLRPTPQ